MKQIPKDLFCKKLATKTQNYSSHAFKTSFTCIIRYMLYWWMSRDINWNTVTTWLALHACRMISCKIHIYSFYNVHLRIFLFNSTFALFYDRGYTLIKQLYRTCIKINYLLIPFLCITHRYYDTIETYCIIGNIKVVIIILLKLKWFSCKIATLIYGTIKNKMDILLSQI